MCGPIKFNKTMFSWRALAAASAAGAALATAVITLTQPAPDSNKSGVAAAKSNDKIVLDLKQNLEETSAKLEEASSKLEEASSKLEEVSSKLEEARVKLLQNKSETACQLELDRLKEAVRKENEMEAGAKL